MDMPREVWAWRDPEDDENIKCWVEPICTSGVKYIRADLVGKVDDEAVREAVEIGKTWLQDIEQRHVVTDLPKHYYALETLIRAATSKCGCEALVEALEICEQTIMEVKHAQREGSVWYTKGAVGLYQQVARHLDLADKAVSEALAAHKNKGK